VKSAETTKVASLGRVGPSLYRRTLPLRPSSLPNHRSCQQHRSGGSTHHEENIDLEMMEMAASSGESATVAPLFSASSTKRRIGMHASWHGAPHSDTDHFIRGVTLHHRITGRPVTAGMHDTTSTRTNGATRKARPCT
jgi:hypothetical protein